MHNKTNTKTEHPQTMESILNNISTTTEPPPKNVQQSKPTGDVMHLVFLHFPMWSPGSRVVLGCTDSRSLPSYFTMRVTMIPEFLHADSADSDQTEMMSRLI